MKVRCPYCDWLERSGPELEALIVAATKLDDHMVVAHEYAYSAASKVASEWLAGILAAGDGEAVAQ